MTADPEAIADLFETVSLGAPEHAVGFVLWRVVHRYQREVDRALSNVELTHLQFTTLMLVAWLSRQGEVATQAEIARFGDIHPMQVSHMLKALETKRMVERTPSATNVRANWVQITPGGVAVLREALPLAIEVQRRMFGEEGRPGGDLLSKLLRIDAGFFSQDYEREKSRE
ncbi:MarR family winged helix-turn-helix transcriptional regulator [Pararhizobium mangrovi]|uniref:MarR family transcriptional regulator n=1 Tax=Pararhizobium mangrovi TaxID=2590452 RepID=A0A506U2W9_9HYPH|nr:MarR family transcriptional regulator [Pararhizobium mangrovi]TPW27696.1 MarR family transcriptional regulator [Pararhizobium mangrovi]